MSAQQPQNMIVDVSAQVADISDYYFLGVGAPVTITGILVSLRGNRVTTGDSVTPGGTRSIAFSAVIPAGDGSTDGVNMATIMGLTGTLLANYPRAGGAIINLSGNVYMDIQGSGAADADFKTHYAKYPIINSGNSIPLSRVASR